MTAYVIGNITVKNPEKWAEYRSQVPATLVPWGAELVLRGTQAKALSGQYRHTDTVVIRFPDMDAVAGWHDSPAYQVLVQLRKEAADVDLVSFEGDG